MEKYKCIIVGAGPSGTSTALNLKKLNIDDILVIDKSTFPRTKPCAGYVTGKTKKILEDLDIDITKHNYKLIKGLNIIYKNKERLKIENKGLWCNKNIDRTELDFALFNKVKEQNIKTLENVTILKHDEEKKTIILSNNGIYEYKYLIFADGIMGYSLKYQEKNKKKNIAMQITFDSNEHEGIKTYFGITKHGYAWVSSSGTTTNIGFSDIYDEKINYNDLFNKFLLDLNHKELINKRKIGFFVPINIKKNKVLNDNIYFVGDAVGAVDPITLAGISYALLTGKFAALSIKNCNKKIYLKKINKISRKFYFISKFMYIFYLKSTLFLFLRLGGKLLGKQISYILDNYMLKNKS